MSEITSRLDQRFDPRSNSLSSLRLGLAGLVAAGHVQVVVWNTRPSLGRTEIGELAVDAFFVISGFLVTRSAAGLPSIRRFAWHRLLRIMPAFWVCLLFSAFVAAPAMALLQDIPLGPLLTGPGSMVGYVVNNAGLLMTQWTITDLPSRSHQPVLGGSLWTLYYEALCYACVGVLAAVGVVRRRSARHAAETGRPGWSPVPLVRWVLSRHLLLVITFLVWAVDALRASGDLRLGPQYLSRFVLMFLFGALGYVYAHRVRFAPVLIAAAALALGVVLITLDPYRVLAGVPFAYLVLWSVVALPLRWSSPIDPSYGTYIYHWPVIQVLGQTRLAEWGVSAFTMATLVLTGILALISWHLVEAPALRHKGARWVDHWSVPIPLPGRRTQPD